MYKLSRKCVRYKKRAAYKMRTLLLDIPVKLKPTSFQEAAGN